MKIGLLADVHYCSKESLVHNTRFPALALERMKAAVQCFANQKADLIVCLGDLINIDDTYDKDVENLAIASDILNSSPVPAVCLMGNHDCEAFTRAEFTELSGLKTAPYEIISGQYALHFLNANYTDDGAAYIPHNIDWQNSCLPAEEIARIRQSICDKSRRHIYFVHQCIDPFSEPRHLIRNAAEARTYIEQTDSPIVIQGHYHAGKRSVFNGVSYLTLPALCCGDTSPAILLDTETFNGITA